MGGFIKGIVVGVISFVLGFAVLSVVIPVDPQAPGLAPEPASGDAAAGEDMAPPRGPEPEDSGTSDHADAPPDAGMAAGGAPASPGQAVAEPEPDATDPEPVQSSGDPVDGGTLAAPNALATPPISGEPPVQRGVGPTEPAAAEVNAPLSAPEPVVPASTLTPGSPPTEGATDDAVATQSPDSSAARQTDDPDGGTRDLVLTPAPVTPFASGAPSGLGDDEPAPAADLAEPPAVATPDVAPADPSVALSDGAPDPEPALPVAPGVAPDGDARAVASDASGLADAQGGAAPADDRQDATTDQTADVSVQDPAGEAVAVDVGQAGLADPADLEAGAGAGPTLAATPEPGSPSATATAPAAPMTPAGPDAVAPLPNSDPTDPPGADAQSSGTAPAPQTLPRVQILPSGVPGVSVRRGAADDAPPAATGAQDAPLRTVPGVTVGRLPRIGAPDGDTPPPEGSGARDPQPDEADLPAWRRHAASVDLPPEARRVGVVLLDAPAAEAALLDLPFPVTVAMDPYDADAPRRAAAYREAGHDVALLAARVPPLATASDIAVTLQVWTQSFPRIIGVMDVPLNGIGSRRALARDMAEMLGPEGLAVIALRGGLDAFLQSAEDAGLARASVYRALDEGGQNVVTIRRLIDRAAFEAQRSDGIVVSGSADSPETIEALTGFAEGSGRSGVVLVPASAVLTVD